MKKWYLVVVILLVFGFSGFLYAAPVGLTSEADAASSSLWAYKDLGVTIGFVGDFVSERKIDIDSGEFEMNAFMSRIGLTMFDKFTLYTDLGAATDMEFNYVIKGEKYSTEFDDAFLWGVGGSALLFRWDNGLEIGLNASYRRTDMELTSTAIDGLAYKRTDLETVKDGDFEEYQAAFEIAWKTQYFTPYIGVKCSEVEVDADFKVGNAQRSASGKNAGENLGAFVGLNLSPKIPSILQTEQMTINIEGRFIDEDAISVGVNYKF